MENPTTTSPDQNIDSTRQDPPTTPPNQKPQKKEEPKETFKKLEAEAEAAKFKELLRYATKKDNG